MKNLIIIIIYSVLSLGHQVPSQANATWELMGELGAGERITSDMSGNGEFYAIYEESKPKEIQIKNTDGETINVIYTKPTSPLTVIFDIHLSYTGQYVTTVYGDYPEIVLRVWDTISGEVVLEVPDVHSFFFNVNNDWLLFSYYGDVISDEELYSVIYDLEAGIEKAQFVGENSGPFTDINAEGTAALMIGNDNVVYQVSFDDSFTKLPISNFDRTEFNTNRAYFYTSEIVALDTVSDLGLNVRFFELLDVEVLHIRDIYYFSNYDVIVDQNIFGFQNAWEYEYGIELINPLNEEVLFQEERLWEYLAISPDNKWIVSRNWVDETLNIYSYPDMSLVTQIENCFCSPLKFNEDSTRFMTVSNDEETSKVLIFELVEE